jgi:hypothetical protein
MALATQIYSAVNTHYKKYEVQGLHASPAENNQLGVA